jgi:hypothetical protein
MAIRFRSGFAFVDLEIWKAHFCEGDDKTHSLAEADHSPSHNLNSSMVVLITEFRVC